MDYAKTECDYSFCKYLLRVCYVSGTVLDNRWVVMNETDIVPEFGSLESSRYKYIDNILNGWVELFILVSGDQKFAAHAMFLRVTVNRTLI